MFVHDKGLDLIDKLRESKMLSHPGVAFHVRRSLETGDYSLLERYLQRYPSLMAIAESNIAIALHQSADNAFKPYPTRTEASKYLTGPLWLGYVNEHNSRFGISWNVPTKPIIDIGRIGTGKSVLVKRLICQVLSKPRSFNIIIPDLKKEYRHLRCINKRLKILTKDKIVINPLQSPVWCHPRDHILAFAKTFVSENYLVGTSENLLIDLVSFLYKERGIFDGSSNYPTLKDLYALITKKLSNTKSFKYSDILLWLQNRLRPYVLSDNFNCQMGIQFEIFRKENLVLEMDTGFTERMYSFTVATIVHQLYMFNKAKNLTGSKLRHWIIVDEARRLFNAYRDISIFGESTIEEDVTKSREFGVSFFLASQETASLSTVVRSLAYLKIAFPLNDAADLQFIQDSFGLTDLQTQYIFCLSPYGVAVVRYGGFERPFLLGVPSFTIKRQLDDGQVEEEMADFWASLEREIVRPQTSKSPEISAQIPAESAALLFYLSNNPFTKYSDIINAPGFKSTRQAKKALNWLVENVFVKMEKYRASRTKKSTFAVLQDKAYQYVGMKGLPGKGSFEHSLYQDIILKKLQVDGLNGRIEGKIKGSNKAMDVLVHSEERGHLAYEVTLNFHNLLSNIHQDLEAGANEVIIVTKDKENLDKALTIISEDSGLDPCLERLSFLTIDHFFG